MESKTRNIWNLELIYKDENDPQVEKDLRRVEGACVSFEKKYKGKNFTRSTKSLRTALEDYVAIEELTDGHKPWWYFNLRKDVDSGDTIAQAKASQVLERYTKASNRITFFVLEIGKISVSKQKVYLKSPDLKDYKYFLKVIFDQAKYNLTEKEEQLAGLLNQPGYSMWVDGNEDLLSKVEIEFSGKILPLAEAMSLTKNLAKAKRYVLHRKINEVLKEKSHFAESEINAIYFFKKIMDERRGYHKPYSATVLHYENDEKTVEALVKVVTQHFKISQKFYRLHAKLLGEKRLTLADRQVAMGEIKKKFNFPYTVEVTKRAFKNFDPKFAEIFQTFLDCGQIDIYPKKGKIGGAYCSSAGKNPTFVLLNHVDNFNSATTLAHEMGHAFHSELSKALPAYYRRYSTATAEVASTFFEQILTEELEKELTSEERVVLLHNKILGDIATIFRQVAFFNFENDLHALIRRMGRVPKEEIAGLMNKHLRSYMGDTFEFSDDDGYFFVYLSHMRRFFYVYSYAYGQLISRVLFEKWKEDKNYAAKIEKFLSAGGSMSPRDIFKSIGVDTSDSGFFETGLKAIEKDIQKLEKLTKGLVK